MVEILYKVRIGFSHSASVDWHGRLASLKARWLRFADSSQLPLSTLSALGPESAVAATINHGALTRRLCQSWAWSLKEQETGGCEQCQV